MIIWVSVVLRRTVWGDINNSPSSYPDDHNLPTYDMTPGFKPFTVLMVNFLFTPQNGPTATLLIL